jgi:plastocyanin
VSVLHPRVIALLALAVTVPAPICPALAVNECVTSNCTIGGTPAACAQRAAPRTPTVLLGSGGLVFTPANPKIEPGDCILWMSASSTTHSSTENSCSAGATCSTPPSAGCDWDSANLSTTSVTTSTCFYDAALFPAASAPAYRCRIHASMQGTLRVTTAIQLTVDKDAGSVKLTWTGGGVTGDVTYKVARQSGGDPAFPAGTTSTVNPDGGVLGTTFTDANDLGNPTTRYYLVRNKQTNEP